MASTGDEFRGKSVEEAIETGLAALGLKRNQVEIEVLSKGSRGLLGLGAEDARVRLTPVVAAARGASQAPSRAAPPAPAGEIKLASKETAAVSQAEPEGPATEQETAPPASETNQVAVELLQGMLDRMDVRATVRVVEHRGVVDEGQEPPIVLNIEGDDLGILIGRRGETLAAIQYLTRLMVNHRVKQWVDLVVDVEGYKARRDDQLIRLAERMAERVASTGRAVALEAMPAHERRIIHIALRDNPYVMTQSVGEGEHRKVTIIPKT